VCWCADISRTSVWDLIVFPCVVGCDAVVAGNALFVFPFDVARMYSDSKGDSAEVLTNDLLVGLSPQK